MPERPKLQGIPFLDLTENPNVTIDPNNPDAPVNQNPEASHELVKKVLRNAYEQGETSPELTSLEDELIRMEQEHRLLKKLVSDPDNLSHEELLYIEWLVPVLRERLKHAVELPTSDMVYEVASFSSARTPGEAVKRVIENSEKEAENLIKIIRDAVTVLEKNGIDRKKGRSRQELLVEAIDDILANQDSVSETTIRQIAALAKEDEDNVVSQLMRLYTDPSSDERRKNIVIMEIGKHGGQKGVDHIDEFIKDISKADLQVLGVYPGQYDSRIILFEALAANGSSGALRALAKYFNDLDDRAKFIILRGLAAHGDNEEARTYVVENFKKISAGRYLNMLLWGICESRQPSTPSLLKEMFDQAPNRAVKDQILLNMADYRLEGTTDLLRSELEHIQDEEIKKEVELALERRSK